MSKEKKPSKETLIIERLKSMTEFNQYVFDGIMNDIDFYTRNGYLLSLLRFYKSEEPVTEYMIMKTVNELKQE